MTVTSASSTSIIRRYLVLTGLYTLSASIIWGVNTLFLLDAGLEILEVFIANAAFTASMALFEIPTGVLADTRGRRASFLLSIGILLIGTVGYVLVAAQGGGLPLFVLMSVVLGLGFTFYSGAMEAWLVDALAETGFGGQLDRVFARAAFVSGAAMLIGTISGGLLGTLDLALPFVVRAALLGILLGIAFTGMHDLGFNPLPARLKTLPEEMRKVAAASLQYGWQNREVRLLILAAMVQAIFTAWGFHAWQPYFLDLLGLDLAWVAGVIAALVALATMAGNALVEFFTRFCGRRTTMILWATGIISVVTIGVGLTDHFFLAVGLYLVSMAASGVISPVKQAYMHQLIPGDKRATVISFDSLVSSGGSMVGQGGLGFLAQMRGLGSGYLAGGILMLAGLPFVWLLRRKNSLADFFEGSRAGHTGACAAQGLPVIGGLESNQSAAAAAD